MDGLLESGAESIDGNNKKATNHNRQNGPMNRRDDPASGEQPLSRSITILHFNDVYNINAREEEPVGGAARFATAMRQLKHLDPLVLFSGDIFNPSVMSAVTKGEQMVPILRALDVKCAVFGNHDFDFGMDHVVDLVKQTQFPWLMSNVYDNVTENTLADGCITHMISWNGRKIGLVGLVEEAWIETLATVDPEEITFVDFVEEGRLLARQLKEEGADVVIALTHMRWPNDVRLAECAPEIDLILGGHDHDYLVKQINGKFVIKSGSDFRNFSEVTLSFLDDGHIDVKVREVVVDSSFPEDAEVKTIVDKYTDVMSEKMETVLGVMDADLEGRFAKVRTEETNLGNFVTDIMLKSVDADLALLNSGTLRSDVVHKAGPFKMKDLLAILPMVDPLVVIQVTGQQIISALENSVSQYPSLEGRFAQVAGVRFGFDAQKPPGHRIDPENVQVQGIPLDLEENYRLCTKQYLAEGKDGYTAFKGCPVLLNDEDGPRLSTCIINYFKSVQMLRDEQKSQHCHRHSILTVTRRKTLTRQMSVDFWIGAETCSETSSSQSWYQANVTMLRRKSMVRQLSIELTSRHTLLQPDNSSSNVSWSKALLQRRSSIEVCEKESVATALAPQVDGRVCVISSQETEGRPT